MHLWPSYHFPEETDQILAVLVLILSQLFAVPAPHFLAPCPIVWPRFVLQIKRTGMKRIQGDEVSTFYFLPSFKS